MDQNIYSSTFIAKNNTSEIYEVSDLGCIVLGVSLVVMFFIRPILFGELPVF